jgi:hypothetical protein
MTVCRHWLNLFTTLISDLSLCYDVRLLSENAQRVHLLAVPVDGICSSDKQRFVRDTRGLLRGTNSDLLVDSAGLGTLTLWLATRHAICSHEQYLDPHFPLCGQTVPRATGATLTC